MNNIKEKIKNIYIPFNHGSFALFISILALSFVIASSNSPCLQAQSTCAIGSDNTFSGNISLKGGTANSGTLDASGMTSDRTYTLPDASGTLALEGATLSASKVMATDVSGNETTTDVYPLSLTINSALKTDGSGNVTASNLDPETDLTIGTGTANQVLSVNSGGTALTFTSITGVPTLTGNQAVVTDGAGALTVANLTADKFVISDSNGSLTTTDIIPLSFGTNKPIVSDAAGNLTDVTLTADTPMKTDANGNTSASDLDITTDITPGSALQEIRVNAGGTALEYFTPGGAGIGRIVASGTADMGYYGESICWQTGSMPFTTNGLDKNKEYRLMINWTENYYNQAITGGGAYNLGFQSMYGDASMNIGRQCDSTTSGNDSYGTQGWHWNSVSNRQPGTCAGTYYRMEGTSSSECRYQNGYSPNYWTDATCNIMSGSMPSSISSAYDYLSFDKIIIDFSSQKDNGIGVSFKYSVSGGFNSSDTTNSNYKATFSGKGSCSYGEANTGTTFESFAGIKLGMWNDGNQVYSDIDWVLIEYN